MIRSALFLIISTVLISVNAYSKTEWGTLEKYFLPEAKFQKLSLIQKKEYLKSMVTLVYAIEAAQGPHEEIQARIGFSLFGVAQAEDKNPKAAGKPCLMGGWKSTYKNGHCQLPVKLRGGKFTCNNFLRPTQSELKSTKSTLSDVMEDILVDFRPTKDLTKRCLDAQMKVINSFSNYKISYPLLVETVRTNLESYFFADFNGANKFDFNVYCAEKADGVCAAIKDFKETVVMKMKLVKDEKEATASPSTPQPAGTSAQ